MRWQKLQFLAVGLVCDLLGFGVASYRNVLTGPRAFAADDQPAKPPKVKPVEATAPPPARIFSPPGTSDTGPVTPPPNEPPFKGKIGRTISESSPDWPPVKLVIWFYAESGMAPCSCTLM